MLSFADAPGNLFNRLGKLGLLVKQARSYQTSQLTNFTDTTNGAVAQYNAESDLQALLGSAYISQLNSLGSNVGSLAQTVAQQTLNRMIFRDNPRIAQNLQSVNIIDSMTELIRQMDVAGATVRAHTLSSTNSTFTGRGNGVVVSSLRRPIDGLVLENAFAETILLTCTSDSFVGSATAGNEGFTVTGVGSQQNYFAFDWPLGSNSSTSLSAIDGSQDNASGNLLTNSSFEDFTSNAPDNFTLDAGTAGTNFFREAGIVYDGTYSLKITSTGSNVQFRQLFNDSTGTAGELDPLTQYSFNVFMRRDSIAPAAGTMEVALVDSTGTIIQDELGNNNSFTFDLTGLTVNFTGYNGVFRTPRVMPSTYYLRVRTTVALTSGRSIYLDRMSLGEMTQLYTSGPFLAVHSGSTAYAAGDYATVAISNTRGAGGALDTFQTLFARLFPDIMIGNEFILPSSATPTISDNLIG